MLCRVFNTFTLDCLNIPITSENFSSSSLYNSTNSITNEESKELIIIDQKSSSQNYLISDILNDCLDDKKYFVTSNSFNENIEFATMNRALQVLLLLSITSFIYLNHFI